MQYPEEKTIYGVPARNVRFGDATAAPQAAQVRVAAGRTACVHVGVSVAAGAVRAARPVSLCPSWSHAQLQRVIVDACVMPAVPAAVQPARGPRPRGMKAAPSRLAPLSASAPGLPSTVSPGGAAGGDLFSFDLTTSMGGYELPKQKPTPSAIPAPATRAKTPRPSATRGPVTAAVTGRHCIFACVLRVRGLRGPLPASASATAFWSAGVGLPCTRLPPLIPSSARMTPSCT